MDQLTLRITPASHGGWRPGAGRPKVARPQWVRRVARPEHAARHPLHVTVRVTKAAASLRAQRVYARVRDAFARSSGSDFRVVQFSVQMNHLHLLVEAGDKRALSRGMKGLGVRVARAVNRALSRRGAVWADRYHARALTTPRSVRNALVYVLNNGRKHGATADAFDPCSSSRVFDGWERDELFYAMRGPPPTRDADELTARAIAPATTWLATVGWRRRGLLRIDESPAHPG